MVRQHQTRNLETFISEVADVSTAGSGNHGALLCIARRAALCSIPDSGARFAGTLGAAGFKPEIS
jgi:hypothetical protein